MPFAGSASTSSPLACSHALDAADAFGVRFGDRGDDTDRRLGDGAQAGDLAEPAHAHLEHEHLDVVGRTQDRDGQPLIVVERPLVGGGTPAGPQHGSGKILHGRLADRPGDADHGARQPGAAPAGEVEQRPRGVVDDDRRATALPDTGASP